MNEKNDFEFLPRPEARATDWDQLLPPLRDAVRDLLLRLDGATAKVVENEEKQGDRADSEKSVTNCFLVYGDRGSGKTTVLLSAQKAVDPKKDFFGEGNEDSKKHPYPKKRGSAEVSARKLKDLHVVWLDVLDLEPLPREANLLTTLLTRVRNALDKDKGSPGHTGPTSLFEEGTDSARQQLEQLIKDATLMWEDIAEQDTRSRANREVAAADIYAGFRKRFHDALHTLSHELGRRRGTDGMPPIILPIDNIDRSSDHLRSMIKLAEMVSCHHLWLVMAGDRVDLDTFLERAYWKELIRVGAGAGGSGKTGPRGEDETFVMARRQAAAASQKLLPPSHRIEVQRVKAEDTLRFWLGHGCISKPNRESKTEQTIYNLLSRILVPTEPPRAEPLRFIDLIDAGKLLASQPRKKTSDVKLTFAARHALWLPARNVIDLWQLAHWVKNDHPRFDEGPNFRAEKIARTMLRYVISPSDMNSELGRRLQNVVIGRNVFDGTLLDFDDAPQQVYHLTTLKDELRQEEPAVGSNWVVRSRLVLRQLSGVILKIGKRRQSSEVGGSKVEQRPVGEGLPILVAAWMTILHDIAALAAKSSVVSSKKIDTAPFVEASHCVVSRTDTPGQGYWVQTKVADGFRWRAPAWRIFLAHEIFRQKWDEVLQKLARDEPVSPEYLGPQLICCWVACALETFAIFMPGVAYELSKNPLKRELGKMKGEDEFDGFRFKVVEYANELYTRVRTEEERFSTKSEAAVVNQWAAMMRDWFELQLPLLLSYPYSPFSSINEKWRTNGKRDELVNAWATKSPFILGELNKSMLELFSTEQEPEREADETLAERLKRAYEGWPPKFQTLPFQVATSKKIPIQIIES